MPKKPKAKETPWWRTQSHQTGERLTGMVITPHSWRDSARGKVRRFASKLAAQGIPPDEIDRRVRKRYFRITLWLLKPHGTKENQERQ